MFKKRLSVIKNERGLTLIELLAVIVILGIIAAIAVPSIGGIIQKSREDGVKADAIQYLNAAKMYYAAQTTSDTNDLDLDSADEIDSKLGEYIEKTSDNLEVTSITFDNGTPRLTGTGTAGNKTITFKSATIRDINEDTSGDDTVTIPNP